MPHEIDPNTDPATEHTLCVDKTPDERFAAVTGRIAAVIEADPEIRLTDGSYGTWGRDEVKQVYCLGPGKCGCAVTIGAVGLPLAKVHFEAWEDCSDMIAAFKAATGILDMDAFVAGFDRHQYFYKPDLPDFALGLRVRKWAKWRGYLKV